MKLGKLYRIYADVLPAWWERSDTPAARQPGDEPEADDGKLLTRAEVAIRLGINPQRVTRWARSGFLKAAWHPPRHHRRWAQKDVMHALNHPESWPAEGRPDVSTEDIIRMRDLQEMPWFFIAGKTGMSMSGVRRRYAREKRKGIPSCPR